MPEAPSGRSPIFDRVLCAVDGSPGSFEAIVQADAVRNELGMIELVGIFEVPAVPFAYGGPAIIADGRRAFENRFDEGRLICPEATAEILDGPVVNRLLERAAESHATLVAVGAPDHRRPLGVALGSVPTQMLHRAPCSVLVARRASGVGSYPQSVVVGYDGSTEASKALSAGCDLVRRLGASLRVVIADHAAPNEAKELDDLPVQRDDRDPVEALIEASQSADLLIVGSRGLRGFKAIGSVSERLGHQSACPTLVVRDAPGR